MNTKTQAFNRLILIMDELREKCPWDKKQTIDSLRYLTIEETYELADAIIEGNMENIKGELGDLMLHIVFYSKIASELKEFDITDVFNTVCDKLIERHPHIYGDVKVKDEPLYHKLFVEYHLNNRVNGRITLKSHWAKADFFSIGIGYKIF